MTQSLHLSAQDSDDLPALSAQMQDAVVRVGDIAYDSRRKTVAIVANRFAWDALPQKTRRRAGLRINHVLSARRKHPKPVTNDSILSLLAIAFTAKAEDDPAGTLTLTFSGGHAIALDVDSLDIQLDDLGPVWGAQSEPTHGN